MSNEKYNGWTNRETWLIPLWWNECPIEEIEAESKEDAIAALAVRLEEIFHETNETPATGLAADLFAGAVARINWHEIAEHYIDDIELTVR